MNLYATSVTKTLFSLRLSDSAVPLAKRTGVKRPPAGFSVEQKRSVGCDAGAAAGRALVSVADRERLTVLQAKLVEAEAEVRWRFAMLEKPFLPKMLTDAVESLLNRKSA